MDKTNYAVGIALLVVVVFLWTLSSFLVQNLLETGYNKPFFITYLSTTTFSLYLIPHLIRRWRRRSRKGEASKANYYTIPPDLVLEPDPLAPLTERETAWLAAQFCLMWFMANWTANAALDFTSVGSCTILASVCGFVTLGISRLFGIETFTFAKLGAVIASFGGVVLVSLSDSSSLSTSSPYVALGDVLALLSAIFYAVYVTFLKIRTKHESRLDAQLFFGFVGLFNGLCLWPAGLVLHFLGWETFQLPPDWMAWSGVLLTMFITLASDYLYVLSMLKTTPLVAAVGLSLTIPLALLGDTFVGHPPALQTLAGAVLVLGAFGAIGYESVREVPVKGEGAGTPRVLQSPPRELETTYGAMSRTPSPIEEV